MKQHVSSGSLQERIEELYKTIVFKVASQKEEEMQNQIWHETLGLKDLLAV